MDPMCLTEGVSVETLCVKCFDNGVTRFLLTPIPRFKDILVSSFECSHCGYKNREVQSGLVLNESGGSRFVLNAQRLEDLNRQIIKGCHATVTLPEIEFEIPSTTQQGVCTTIEGLLTESVAGLRRIIDQQDSSRIPLIKRVIESLEAFALGSQFPFTLILEDPAGHSFIEPLTTGAFQSDPQLTITYFERTLEQLHSMGYYEDQNENSDAAQDVSGALETKNKKKEESTNIKKTYAQIQINEKALPNQLRISGWDLNKSVEENLATVVSCKSKVLNNEEDLTLRFAVQCPNCLRNGFNNMCEIEIPGFRKCMIMAFVCDGCGSRSTDVKPMGAYGANGKKWILHVSCQEDLNRDVLKSDTAAVRIPQIQFEMCMGTLGGLFTTVEGLLLKVIDNLFQNCSVFVGDSSDLERRQAFEAVLEKLHQFSTDPNQYPFDLCLDDPADLSMISSRYSSTTAKHHKGSLTLTTTEERLSDPFLIVESYERSKEQNDDLGLCDMCV